MHSSPHRNNSDFQLRHFMANNCHTADTAWCLMYEQRLDIKMKLEATRAQVLRREARRIEIEEVLNNLDATPAQRLRAEADMIEWNSGEGMLEMAIKGAEMELNTIESIMAELEPQRKYGHLPVLEASQAAQREEWLGEFKRRCENYLLSIGTIPEDHLNAMRNHPDFEQALVPHVQQVMQRIESSANKIAALKGNQNLLLESRDAG